MKSALSHHGIKHNRLYRNRFAARIRTGDHDHLLFPAEGYRDRHDLVLVDQRMPRGVETDQFLFVQRRLHPRHPVGECRLREDEVKDLHMDSFHQQSLDAPIAATDGESNLYDILPSQDYHTPEMELAKIMLHQQMDNLLDTLPETEANILRLQFGLNCEVPMTIIEISNQLDMSEKDVQRLSGKALRRLRNNPSCEMMRTYLQ